MPSTHLPNAREMVSSRSAPSLGPLQPHNYPTLGKGIYEVTSGHVTLRAEPHLHCPSLGCIRGGVRLLATPHKIGNKSWLKVQTENVTPPFFSPSGLGRPQDELYGRKPDLAGRITYRPTPGKVYNQSGIAKGLSLYQQSVPKPAHSVPDWQQSASELWLQDEQCIVRLRNKAPDPDDPMGTAIPTQIPSRPVPQRFAKVASVASHQSHQSASDAVAPVTPVNEEGLELVNGVWLDADASSPLKQHIQSLEEQLEANSREIAVLKSKDNSTRTSQVVDPKRDKMLSLITNQGSGSWVNFGSYGPIVTPSNDNCGRWRQLEHGSLSKARPVRSSVGV